MGKALRSQDMHSMPRPLAVAPRTAGQPTCGCCCRVVVCK